MVGPPGSRGRNFPRVGILPRLFDERGDQGKPRPLSGGPKKFGPSRPSTNSVFKFIRTAGVTSPQSSEVLICVSICRGLLGNFFQFYLHMEGGWPSERYALKVRYDLFPFTVGQFNPTISRCSMLFLQFLLYTMTFGSIWHPILHYRLRRYPSEPKDDYC